MTRTPSILSFILGGLAALWLALPLFAADKSPNIILILADDLGRETLGAYGGSSYKTPNLDKLATDGLRFDVCYATPLCSPTRVELLSGRYNFRNYTEWGAFDFENERTIAQVVGEAGYDTAVVGKWHLGGWEERPFGVKRAGFDRYATFNYPEVLAQHKTVGGNVFWNTLTWTDGERYHTGDNYTPAYYRDYAVKFIQAHAKEGAAPYFLYYPLALAHRPFVVTEETGDASQQGQKSVEHFPPMVAYIDRIVGEIRQAVEDSGQAENTLILFSADNGTDDVNEAKTLRSEFMGQMVPGGKYLPSELGANVPLLAWWPGTIEPGRTYGKPIDFTDMLPTFRELSGSDLDAPSDGHSFVPVLKGEGDSPRKYAYTWGIFEHSSKKYKTPIEYQDELLHILRDDRWKYYSDGRLIDTKEDFLEENPVPENQRPEIRDRMRRELEKLRGSGERLW